MNLGLTGYSADRKPLDFYPTPVEVTQSLMLFLSDRFSNVGEWHVYEPCCGDGAMSNAILPFVQSVTSSDIRNTGYGTPHVDFTFDSVRGTYEAVITNPPFMYAEDFIRRAVEMSPVVCMLLKSQFWHAKTRVPLFTDHPPAYVLPLTWRPDFLNGEKGGRPTMECAWNVWIRGVSRTTYFPLNKPAY